MSGITLTDEMRAYAPRGVALALLYDRRDEICLNGPAGTGKSRANLEKIHACMEKYAGARALIVRKTRASLSESGLVTFEDKVLPAGHPALTNIQRSHRQSYHYPNGSEIVIGGMDKPTKVMSTEYDIIYPQEAIELTENDWESLTTRLRNGVMPYQQLIADTNPDTPYHWLKKRADKGLCVMLESRHEDNPVLWDAAKGEWTERGKVYIAKLERLTGPRLARLRYGKWVSAEGQIYEGFDRAVHVIDRFDIPRAWPRFWVVDFGYRNPFVWQAWAQDDDGRLYLYKEIYFTERLVEDHARRILEITKGEPRPQIILCDHDAEDRATLERKLGLSTQAAKKDVSPGIQAVQSRFKVQPDAKPGLYLLRDSLDERDARLSEAAKPCSTDEEIDGYIWNIKGGRRKGEEPLKENDHGCDTMRYMVANRDLVGQIEVGESFF